MYVQVSYLADKDVKSVTALKALEEAKDMLLHVAWSTLLHNQAVKPMKGPDMVDVYELRMKGYRAAFCLYFEGTAFIFAFFKKEGAKLKMSQLYAISSRAKTIRNALNSQN